MPLIESQLNGNQGGQRKTGVFIPRRDTSALVNTLVGGRLFPGVHHRANFDVHERGDRFYVQMTTQDGAGSIEVDATRAASLPDSSVFASVDAASAFFQAGSDGYSPHSRRGLFDGLRLECAGWRVEPLRVGQVKSAFMSDESCFPPGSVAFDSALLMQHIDHRWHSLASISCGPA